MGEGPQVERCIGPTFRSGDLGEGWVAELKTKQTAASVEAFLAAIPDSQRRDDALAVAAIMKAATRTEPRMWGGSIVGYGEQHYKYASGREGDWFRGGFSPRKEALSVYITSSFDEYPDIMSRLGKYKTGTSRLHIKRLAEVDTKALRALITRALKAPLPGKK